MWLLTLFLFVCLAFTLRRLLSCWCLPVRRKERECQFHNRYRGRPYPWCYSCCTRWHFGTEVFELRPSASPHGYLHVSITNVAKRLESFLSYPSFVGASESIVYWLTKVRIGVEVVILCGLFVPLHRLLSLDFHGAVFKQMCYGEMVEQLCRCLCLSCWRLFLRSSFVFCCELPVAFT